MLFKRVTLLSVVFFCFTLAFTVFNYSVLFSSLNSSDNFFFSYKSYHDFFDFQRSVLRSHTNVIIFVATSPSNIDRRNAVRSTWANQSLLQYSFSLPKGSSTTRDNGNNGHSIQSTESVRFIVKFLLGVSGSVTMDNRLKEENLTHGVSSFCNV